jgi:hypothetical protein
LIKQLTRNKAEKKLTAKKKIYTIFFQEHKPVFPSVYGTKWEKLQI